LEKVQESLKLSRDTLSELRKSLADQIRKARLDQIITGIVSGASGVALGIGGTLLYLALK
jgi:hypothetical protein